VVFEKLPEVPHLVLAVFIEKPTPFLEEFFIRTMELDYPKDKIDLFIHNSEEFHVPDVEALLSKSYWICHVSSYLLPRFLVKVSARSLINRPKTDEPSPLCKVSIQCNEAVLACGNWPKAKELLMFFSGSMPHLKN